MAAGNQRKQASLADGKLRVQGVTGDQTVKSTPGNLQRIIVANTNAAVQTLAVKDGATTQVVTSVPPNDTRDIPFGVGFTTSIVVTPSHANIDALVLYD
jgi:hypothetical protein